MTRRHDVRKAKRLRTSTAFELAEVFRVTTIRLWTKSGLKPIDGTRP